MVKLHNGLFYNTVIGEVNGWSGNRNGIEGARLIVGGDMMDWADG